MKLSTRLYLFLSNNILINNLLIWLKLDHKLQLSTRQWQAFAYNSKKTEQENAGFSHRPEVQEAIDSIKLKLKRFVEQKIPKQKNILDFGCGTCIYMNLFDESYNMIGIDVSQGMIDKARKDFPNKKFYCNNFLLQKFEEKYSLIYSISVLEYVPVSQIQDFFKKCSDLLEDDGYLFIQYPHALQYKDLLYPDRNYINYSPKVIEKNCSLFFDIEIHKQFFDGRKVNSFDKKPYPTTSKDFRNGYLLVAKKIK